MKADGRSSAGAGTVQSASPAFQIIILVSTSMSCSRCQDRMFAGKSIIDLHERCEVAFDASYLSHLPILSQSYFSPNQSIMCLGCGPSYHW